MFFLLISETVTLFLIIFRNWETFTVNFAVNTEHNSRRERRKKIKGDKHEREEGGWGVEYPERNVFSTLISGPIGAYQA